MSREDVKDAKDIGVKVDLYFNIALYLSSISKSLRVLRLRGETPLFQIGHYFISAGRHQNKEKPN
jgi:hypothetical protein